MNGTYLCPACDGHGATWGNCHHHAHDPACDCERMCGVCEESGVVHLTRAEGERLGLHPWTGDEGRRAARNTYLPPDPLLTLAALRAKLRGPHDEYLRAEYLRLRSQAMRPVSRLAQADMLAMAQRCVTATERLHATMRGAA